jgi:hypothetical protein
MRLVRTWAVVGCLVLAASAGDGERLAADQLPPEVAKGIREFFRAEPLDARKELEGGKACYVVTATCQGQVIEIYASPDGHALIRKTEEFSIARWPGKLARAIPFVLLLMVVGAVVRGVVRSGRGRPLSVPAGLLSAWLGTAFVMALIAFNLATVPREKDVPVIIAECAVWAAIAASLVELVGLGWQSRQPDRSHRRFVIGCWAVAAASLALSIPLDILRVERENRHLKQIALRPEAG